MYTVENGGMKTTADAIREIADRLELLCDPAWKQSDQFVHGFNEAENAAISRLREEADRIEADQAVA